MAEAKKLEGRTVVPEGAIDIDAMLAKREEEVGSRDRFPFVFNGELFWGMDETLADDEWTEELFQLSNDEDMRPWDIAAHYLGGEDEYERFKAAGGSANKWAKIRAEYRSRQDEVDGEGNPTRAPRSFNRAQRRSKRR